MIASPNVAITRVNGAAPTSRGRPQVDRGADVPQTSRVRPAQVQVQRELPVQREEVNPPSTMNEPCAKLITRRAEQDDEPCATSAYRQPCASPPTISGPSHTPVGRSEANSFALPVAGS